MAKKKKAAQLEAWCWYCDREFEDDNVLLQHQKAKHYKCPYCPRRLNTAGGLTVHLHQVHKAEPTRIENALPGRDSFDIEIYGMVGIPEADLAEWKARKAAQGQASGQPSAKRQKVENVALTPEQLKAQLEAHKALMSGQAPPPGSLPPPGYPAGPPPSMMPFGVPPPAFPSGPPPGFGPPPMHHGAPPYGIPPPAAPRQWGTPAYAGPPPNITVPTPSPHQVALRDGAKSRMAYSDQQMSPEEKMSLLPKYTYVDPDDPPAAQQHVQGQQLQSGPSVLPDGMPWQHQQPPPPLPYYGGPPPPIAPANGSPYAYPPPGHSQGYAPTPPYPPMRPPPAAFFAGSQSPSGPPPNMSVPPPGMSPNASSAMSPTSYSGPPPGFAPPSGPSALSTSSSTAGPVPAQSYPAATADALPPASNPNANTAEALNAVNQGTVAGEGVTGGEREVDVRQMEQAAGEERRVETEQKQSVVAPELNPSAPAAAPVSDLASATPSTKSTPGRRAKAADLF